MTLAVTVTLVNVPTDVIFGCAAVVTVPAVVAEVALGTVPVTLAPGIDVNPAPEPLNCEPVTCPLALSTPVMYSPVVAQTTTFEVPPMVKLALPLDAVVRFVVPLINANAELAVPAARPVSCEPLPKK